MHLITIDEKRLEGVQSQCADGNRSKGVMGERMARGLEMKYKGKRQVVEALAVNPNAQISNIALAICSFNIIMMLGSNLDVISRV